MKAGERAKKEKQTEQRNNTETVDNNTWIATTEQIVRHLTKNSAL